MENITNPEGVRQASNWRTLRRIGWITTVIAASAASCLFMPKQNEPVAKAVRATKPPPVIPMRNVMTTPSITTDQWRIRSTACEEELQEFMRNDPPDIECAPKGMKALGDSLYVTVVDANAAPHPYDHERIYYRKVLTRYLTTGDDEQHLEIDGTDRWELWYEKHAFPFKGSILRPQITTIETGDTGIANTGKVMRLKHTTIVPYDTLRTAVGQLLNNNTTGEDRQASFFADNGDREFFHVYAGPVIKVQVATTEETASATEESNDPMPVTIEQNQPAPQ